ncbi:hypothetical protein CVT26_002373 [Gymnopilus dilepis]|uniref:F-box domain-containing protein n=1 Tax=Gymnopilus dilepis TaxID=231916 RepID=A0A409Y3M7_9AGAR|nr:hypothetical protein CVT26_002373 [Gymnopilus dilepis]
MAYPILPPELIILIINNIDSSSIEGRDTLSAFGQTGHAFRGVCQEILFQDLKIVDRYPPYSRIEPRENMIRLEHPRSQRFNDILREAPHLGGYIQSLRLSLLPSRGDPFNADLVVKENPFDSISVVDLGRLFSLRRLSILSVLRPQELIVMTRGVSKNLWTIGAMLQTLPVDRLLPRQVQLDFVFLMDHLGSFINDLPTFPWGHVTSALDQCSTCISEIMEPPILPNELIFLIIDHIDPSSAKGRRSLSAFSLTNRDFRFACQKRMFQNVEISFQVKVPARNFLAGRGERVYFGDCGCSTGWKLRDLLTRSPHIGQYVQHLKIVLSLSMFSEWCLASSESPDFSLYAVTPRLLNLKKVSAFQEGLYACYPIGERMQAFLTTLTSTVAELDLFGFSAVPAAIFSGCHNLRELGVSTLEVGEGSFIQGSVTTVKLRKLHIGFSRSKARTTTWFSTPQSPLDISELVSLTFANHLVSKRDLNGLLALCFSTLEELKFCIYRMLVGGSDDNVIEPAAADLGGLHKLRSLTLIIRDQDLGMPDQLLSIAAILKSLPFRNLQPQQLRIDLSFAEKFNANHPHLPWSCIVDSLEENKYLSRLSGVNIIFGHVDPDRLPARANTTLTQILDQNECLRNLREGGLLSYQSY